MKKVFCIIILLCVVVIITVGVFVSGWKFTPTSLEYKTEKGAVVILDNIKVGQQISSPLVITGKVHGNWFFEASFPIFLVDWDGKIITQTIAKAQSDWMTTDFVNFEATLEFQNPYKTGDADFMHKGAIILKKDNPSGLPQNDDSLEIPITF